MLRKLAVAMVGVCVMAAGSVLAKSHGKEITTTVAEEVKWSPLDPQDTEGKGPQFSVVFGDMKKKAPLGFLLKLPAGFKPGPHTHSSDDYVVVVKGTAHNFAAGGDEGKAIGPGGTWFQPGNVAHDNHCEEASDCILYVYVPKGFDFKPVKDAKAAAAGSAKSSEATAAK